MDLISKKIYLKNTLSGDIETFKPNRRKHVGMYNCGPTVYNKAHIGNLSAYIFADVLKRLFTEQKYKVDQVINITDVGHLTDDGDNGEDKVESQSKKTGETAQEISKKYTDDFMESLEKLNIITEGVTFPKATDHIEEQVKMIDEIEKEGLAYKTSDGIYFDTKKYGDYGKLGGIDIDGLQEGARVEVNTEKKNSTDFALWKFSNPDEKRQQEWNSPWGVGFPGWHIECSAMSKKYLGENFDIHTGGIDHISTHHNNEIAQSGAVNHKLQANYWLHANHIMLNGEKISKSIGNVVYLEDFEKRNVPIAVFRYWYLTSHYATSANFTWDTIGAAEKAFNKIIKLVKENPVSEKEKYDKKYYNQALKELNHSVGTAEAIAVIWEIIKDNKLENKTKVATILKIDRILGIGFKKESLKNEDVSQVPADIIEIANKRKVARKNRDFAESDKLRDIISQAGYNIIDKGDDFEIVAK